MAQNVSVRYILCKSKCEFMAIELNWNWFAAPASRGCPLLIARCPLPYTIFCWCFSAAVALPGTQKSMLRFWWPDKRVTGDKPRGKLATAIYELVVSCQLIMFMCTAKPQQVVYNKERERRRQREERETMTDNAKQTANSVERNQSNEPCWLK